MLTSILNRVCGETRRKARHARPERGLELLESRTLMSVTLPASPTPPVALFNGASSTAYDPIAQAFSVTALPSNFYSTSSSPGIHFAAGTTITLTAKVDDTGVFVVGSGTPLDLVVSGTLDDTPEGGGLYTGTLIQGTATGFWFQAPDASGNGNFQVSFHATGGSMLPALGGSEIVVNVIMAADAGHPFVDFTQSFSGQAEGTFWGTPDEGGGGASATIGFWHNKNGKAVILSAQPVNGVSLPNWLATNFPHLFGSLAGKTNLDVYNLFNSRTNHYFGDNGAPKVNAQVMCTVLASYFDLVNNNATAQKFGFSGNLGGFMFNVGANGAAFNVANNTSISIMQALKAVDSHTSASGVIDASYAGIYNTVFDYFNNKFDI